MQHEGHVVVPTQYVDLESNFSLGAWINRIWTGIVAIDGVDATRHARRARLESPELIWKPQDARSDTTLGAFRRFMRAHGHGRVRHAFVEPGSGIALGRWVHSLRYKVAKLNAERFARLNDTGFIWDRVLKKLAAAKARLKPEGGAKGPRLGPGASAGSR